MAGQWILEDDGVLALDYEVGYVEGSKIHPPVGVGCIIARSGEMVESCWDVHH